MLKLFQNEKDNNFEFEKNGEQFPIRVENAMRKGEIARNEQFFVFQQCFQLNQINVSPFVHIFDIISLFAIELEEPFPTMFSKAVCC